MTLLYSWKCKECKCTFSGHCDMEELMSHYEEDHPGKGLYIGDISDIFIKQASGVSKRKKKSHK